MTIAWNDFDFGRCLIKGRSWCLSFTVCSELPINDILIYVKFKLIFHYPCDLQSHLRTRVMVIN